ncbi:MAG TPA: hypothetical protein VLT89_02715 [Usitatibacter sp.]|nr:hypothetical protein [Usitatibacter sp.]
MKLAINAIIMALGLALLDRFIAGSLDATTLSMIVALLVVLVPLVVLAAESANVGHAGRAGSLVPRRLRHRRHG